MYKEKNSRVSGYLFGNAFLGYIRTPDDYFHLEKRELDGSFEIVMYPESTAIHSFYQKSKQFEKINKNLLNKLQTKIYNKNGL